MYQWIVVTSACFSFLAAMGIGANDVANAYATAIGSRALTMKQAVFLASIFETSGALLMGSHVTETIRKGIADYECFVDDPGALMYGCMWVCLSVGLWLFLASKYEMPVSTTHSCVGGMIGMTLALKGPGCVTWYEEREGFPYIGGVAGIVMSWVLSPIFSAIISSAMYGTVRHFILRSPDSFNRTTYLFPSIIGSVVSLNAFFIIYKGAKGLGLDGTPLMTASVWSFGAGSLSVLIVYPMTGMIRNAVTRRVAKRGATIDLDNIWTGGGRTLEMNGMDLFSTRPPDVQEKLGCCGSVVRCINDNLNVRLDDIIAGDDDVAAIHDSAEVFEERTEEYFKSLQVFTAMCDSFSHGANDVANAIGPFAAIYMIARDSEVNEDNELGNSAYWILGMGGVGMSAGLLLYGYKIIHAIGLKLCKITPSRGVAIELASAIVVITGSRLGIPLSTTHCQVGATMGVAALESPTTCSGINCHIVGKTIVGWVVTLIVVGGTTALLTAQGAHAPEVGVYPCEEL